MVIGYSRYLSVHTNAKGIIKLWILEKINVKLKMYETFEWGNDTDLHPLDHVGIRRLPSPTQAGAHPER